MRLTSVISISPRADGFRIGRDLGDLLVVEVEAGNGIVRFRLLWLFFDAEGFAVFVELDHAVALRILDRIGEDQRPSDKLAAPRSLAGKPWP